jgi:hypothetical protein
MRGSNITRALIVASLLAFSSFAFAPAFAAPPAGHYSTAETDIGTLLDDPAAKAVINQHVPGFSSRDRIDMARSMTLKALQPYDPTFTDKLLAEIDVDLAKLPVKQ